MIRKDAGTLGDMARNAQFEDLFATPVFSHVLRNVETLNTELRELILERERTTPSMAKSNQGGWQSAPDFFRWSEPPVAAIESFIGHAISIATLRVTAQPELQFGVELYGWAAVNRKGHYNTTHVHPMATWSGVYYVDPGNASEDTPSAVLEFAHPVTASVMTFFPNVLPSARVVKPRAGMLILFPSYLQHSVRMYHGESPRICVPFNAHMAMVGKGHGPTPAS
ncbi:2OG-Fe(II) oxygenase family protein [Methylonatrum kenyense]|uniref:TIGR02466 family protein n=1 Tax=Methylonatrum kenyense TaxID=455253 RepID=UPI0020C0E21A|nr:TIGR02466 family protein [Methylonatrum kenyense]MCK8517270.1 2OG-Fe(II) oxygenase family protein [Methylonatrum kenyense]